MSTPIPWTPEFGFADGRGKLELDQQRLSFDGASIELHENEAIVLYCVLVAATENRTCSSQLIRDQWPRLHTKPEEANIYQIILRLRKKLERLELALDRTARGYRLCWPPGEPPQKDAAWKQWYVPGSQLHRATGRSATLAQPAQWHPACFMGPATVILGRDVLEGEECPTTAEWTVPSGMQGKRSTEALLLVACERTHGGLHTPHRDRAARVYFNGHARDLIALKDIPPGHTDFFHRPSRLVIPDVWPFHACGTVYSWLLHPHQWNPDSDQLVRIELDDGVLWDIDYVGIVVRGREDTGPRG